MRLPSPSSALKLGVVVAQYNRLVFTATSCALTEPKHQHKARKTPRINFFMLTILFSINPLPRHSHQTDLNPYARRLFISFYLSCLNRFYRFVYFPYAGACPPLHNTPFFIFLLKRKTRLCSTLLVSLWSRFLVSSCFRSLAFSYSLVTKTP